MRYAFLILMMLWFFSKGFSQTKSSSEGNENIIICGVIEKDAYVDIKHWQTYLDQNLQLDSLALDTIPAGTYDIGVVFIIDKQGCLTGIRIQNDPGYGLGDKIVKVISGYQQWIPAERNGRKVRAYRKQMVTIIAGKEECKVSSNEFIL